MLHNLRPSARSVGTLKGKVWRISLFRLFPGMDGILRHRDVWYAM